METAILETARRSGLRVAAVKGTTHERKAKKKNATMRRGDSFANMQQVSTPAFGESTERVMLWSVRN